MTLKFEPYVSPDTYLAYRDKSETRPQAIPNDLLKAIQLYQQGNNYHAQQERQKRLDAIDFSKERIAMQNQEYKYGRNPNPDAMLGVDYGENGQSSFMPGGSGPVARPIPEGEALNQFRAEGMPIEKARPEFMTMMGEDERKLFQEKFQPKDISYQKAEYTDANGRTRSGRFNPRTGNIEKRSDDPLAPQSSRSDLGMNLRNEFINRPEVKEFQTVGTNVKTMDSLLRSALSGNMQNKLALDQSLITMYNKLTDPNSVVRESEYARTPENIPVMNRISGAIQKVQAGGAGLTDEDRKALVIGAKIIANERGGTYSRTRQGYVDLANRGGVDPFFVTATMPEFNPYSLDEQPNPVGSETRQIGGKNYIKINGEWYEQ